MRTTATNTGAAMTVAKREDEVAPYLCPRVRGLYDGGKLVAVAILAVGPGFSNDAAESHRMYLESCTEQCAQVGVSLAGEWVRLRKSEFRRLAPESWAPNGTFVRFVRAVAS